MSGYKCPHCEYYMWEGKEFYECDIQNKVSKLEQENTELRSTLQEIMVIAEQLLEKGLEPQSVEHQLKLKGKRELANIILDLITKAESEG